jgi:4'-phosphopantetheinyl transferase
LGSSFELARFVRGDGVLEPSRRSSPDFPGFDLAGDAVHVWRVDLLALAQVADQPWTCLAADELAQAGRFHFALDRQRFLMRRAARRQVLSRYLKVDPSHLQFSTGPQGKPGLIGPEFSPGLRFNCSHSADLALIAVSRGIELGVDVEQHRPLADALELAGHCFSPPELAALANLPASLRAGGFFDCWTRKEAFVKALARGLSFPFHQFTVDFRPDHPARLLAVGNDPGAPARWIMRSLEVHPEYSAALVIEAHPANLSRFHPSG